MVGVGGPAAAAGEQNMGIDMGCSATPRQIYLCAANKLVLYRDIKLSIIKSSNNNKIKKPKRNKRKYRIRKVNITSVIKIN